MDKIRQALQRKQAQQARLTKEIELLRQAEDKLREIAPLLADGDDDDATLLVEGDEPSTPLVAETARATSAAAASTAGNLSTATTSEGINPPALRWP
jgi:hypothetical protein